MKKIIFTGIFLLSQYAQAQTDLHLDMEYLMDDSTNIVQYPIVMNVTVADFAESKLAYQNAFNQSLKLELEEDHMAGFISDSLFEAKLAELEFTDINERQIGTESSPWYENLNWQIKQDTSWISWSENIHVLDQPKFQNVSTIGGSMSNTVWFGIDQTDVASMTTNSKIEVRIGYTMNAEITYSNVVSFIMKSSNEPINKLVLAEYWFRRGDLSRAEALVNEQLQSNEQITWSLHILGDIYEQNGDFEAALDTYQTALEAFFEEFPNEFEDPVVLRKKIYALQTRGD